MTLPAVIKDSIVIKDSVVIKEFVEHQPGRPVIRTREDGMRLAHRSSALAQAPAHLPSVCMISAPVHDQPASA
jgi:hypothetical protein